MNDKDTADFATKMVSKRSQWSRWLIVVLCLSWSLIAFAADSGEYLREAQAYFDKGEVSAAVIQLKNALLADPDNKAARLLLGQAYLKQKNGLSAEKELRRAQELGVAREAVLVPLGRALLMTRQNDKLLQAISPEAGDPDALKVDILLLQGQAYLASGKLALADEKFAEALALKPTAADALLGKARIAYQNQDMAATSELVDRALSLNPDSADAWTLKGELLRSTGQQQEAVTAFQKAIAIEPGNIPARLGRATALLALGEADRASADIDWLLQKYPNLYLAHYLKALVQYQHQQLAPAQASIQLALKQAPGHLPSHLLAGTIAYQQQQLNQAEQHLRTYWSSDPGNRQTAKLLAAILLKLKRPDDAIEVLEPGVSSAADDAQYLALLGSAYLSQGDTARGLDTLEQAAAMAPDVAGIRTQLAIGQLAQGDVEQGISELQSAVELGQGLVQADVLLVMVYLQRKDFDQALSAIDTLAGKMPDSPVPPNFKGAALLGKTDHTAARRAFEAALKLQPEFLPAHLNLAQLDLMAGNKVAAQARYRKVLSYDEGNLKALLALAVLAERDGQVEEKAQWLKQARKQHPEAIQPALLLVQHYLQQAETTRALDLAKSVAVAHPRDPRVLRLLAQIQLKAGNEKAALDTLRHWLADHPKDVATRGLLAQAQHGAGQPAAAIEEYLKLLEADPDNVQALNNLAWLYQQENNPEGIKYAERAYQLVPHRAEVIDTLGWLLVQNGDVNRGLVLLQEATAKAPHLPEIRYHMAAALEKAGRREEARKELERLLKSNKTFPERGKAAALRDQLGG